MQGPKLLVEIKHETCEVRTIRQTPTLRNHRYVALLLDHCDFTIIDFAHNLESLGFVRKEILVSERNSLKKELWEEKFLFLTRDLRIDSSVLVNIADAWKYVHKRFYFCCTLLTKSLYVTKS